MQNNCSLLFSNKLLNSLNKTCSLYRLLMKHIISFPSEGRVICKSCTAGDKAVLAGWNKIVGRLFNQIQQLLIVEGGF